MDHLGDHSGLRPSALALDFDGVVCNGLKEYFQVSLRAYGQIWPTLDQVQASKWEPLFGRLRPVVETGWEMPLVLKAIEEGHDEAGILLNWPQIRAQVLARSQLTASQLNIKVDTLRDQWIMKDLQSWLALQEFYSGVAERLRCWITLEIPLFIITTKESRFVDALLSQNGVSLPAAKIFGKDRKQPKTETLRQLQGQGWNRIWFIEDRFETLKVVQTQPELQSVTLFLADWGYNTERERQAAISGESIHLLSLQQFSQPFEQWLS
jgi:phosphoglycolate phosphatase-like HAD superfamily hydrolase